MDSPLPSKPAVERLLLGIAISHGREVFAVVSEIVQAQHFAGAAHRSIWNAANAVYQNGMTPERVLVCEELMRHKGQLEAAGGLGYLVDLDSGLPSISNPYDYAEQVREVGDRRIMAEAMYRQYERLCSADATSADMQASAETVRSLGAGGGARSGLIHAKDLLSDLDSFFADEFSVAGVVKPPRVWGRIGRLIDGFRPGELIILAARPGVGKSIASAMWAYDAAAYQGIPTAVFSLEMQSESILKRIIAANAQVSLRNVRRGKMTKTERYSALQVVETVNETPLYMSQNQVCTVAGMHAAVQRLSTTCRIGFVVVDYLQLMRGHGRSRVEEVSGISRDLKLAAGDLGVPILALSQLSRAGDKEGRPPVLSDLRESGTIEQDADMVKFLHPPNINTEPDRRDFILAKQRDGVSHCKICMRLIGDQVRLEEEEEERL